MLSSASTLVFSPLVRTYLHYAINTAQFIKKTLNFFIKKLITLLVTYLLFVFLDEFNCKGNAQFLLFEKSLWHNVHFSAAFLIN